jgi:hypothetical protein
MLPAAFSFPKRERAGVARFLASSFKIGDLLSEVVFSAAERRPMVAQGEALAEGQAEPWERNAIRNQAPEGRQKPSP